MFWLIPISYAVLSLLGFLVGLLGSQPLEIAHLAYEMK